MPNPHESAPQPSPEEVLISPTIWDAVRGRLDHVGELDSNTFNAIFENNPNQAAVRHADDTSVTLKERLAIFEALQASGKVAFEPDAASGKYRVHHPAPAAPKPTEHVPPIIDRSRRQRLGLRAKQTLGGMASGIQGRTGYTTLKQHSENRQQRADQEHIAAGKARSTAAFEAARRQWQTTRHTTLKLQYEPKEIAQRWPKPERVSRVGLTVGGAAMRGAASGIREARDRRDTGHDSAGRSARGGERMDRSGDTARGGERDRTRSLSPDELYQHDLDRYNQMLARIDQLRNDPTYGALVSDPNKLAQLHKDIQAEAWPLYEARLQELNEEIEAGNKFVSDDNKRPLLTFKDLPRADRQEIVGPIDARLTGEFLQNHLGTGTVVPADVMRTFTDARLVARGKITRPDKNDPKYRRNPR